MGFALTPGEAPLHFSRSKNVMHVAEEGRKLVACKMDKGEMPFDFYGSGAM